ncbi:MAG: maleylacetoacetate isomerase [Nitrospirota bacterium]|nr:maleylacetoacetate isomerase [Nitrospirota bacterium]
MQLYDYWRSSAAYRVRIALNLKGLAYEQLSVDLPTGAQRSDAFLAQNPQGLVPYLKDGALGVGQSLAIINYLNERYPEPPFLPADLGARAEIRALALLIVCEIHPLNNLRVLRHLEHDLGQDEAARLAWYHHWLETGFDALETALSARGGTFCWDDAPGFADVCLVPQVYNAERYQFDLTPYPAIRRINQRCLELDAFDRARPERQPDAPK